MSRFINLTFFVLLSACIYTTFSVKDDVGLLAKKVALLKKNIRNEQSKIDIYKAELAILTGAPNIDRLKEKLIPDLKVVSVDQIRLSNNAMHSSQLAENRFTKTSSMR